MNIIENKDSIIDNEKNKISRGKIVMIVVLLLFNFILCLNIGYAASNELLDVNGTSNVNGKFEMLFNNAKIEEIKGVKEGTASIIVTPDSKKLIVNAGELQYPGAMVKYSVDIVNGSLIPVIIESINSKGLENSSVIKVEGFENISQKVGTLEAGQKYTVEFSIYWDSSCNYAVNETVNFEFDINFSQDI